MSTHRFLALAVTSVLLLALAVLGRRERRTRRQFRELVDAIPGGFTLWDARDRLVMWNGAFRDIYALCRPALKRGITYEELIRYGVRHGQYPQSAGREDAFVRELVDAHRRGSHSAERQLANGRWILIHKERTPSGNVVAVRTDITALKAALAEAAEAHDVAHHMAHHDALTGLPNRVLFHERVDAALATLRAGGPAFSVLCLDLDRFKAVNDRHGHAGGDELLGAVARRLLAEAPGGSTVARLSGDEFAILAFERDGADAAADLAGRIIARVGAPYDLMTGRAEIGVSVGASPAGAASTRDGLIARADRALYEAKAVGRGAFRAAVDGGPEARHLPDEAPPGPGAPPRPGRSARPPAAR